MLPKYEKLLPFAALILALF